MDPSKNSIVFLDTKKPPAVRFLIFIVGFIFLGVLFYLMSFSIGKPVRRFGSGSISIPFKDTFEFYWTVILNFCLGTAGLYYITSHWERLSFDPETKSLIHTKSNLIPLIPRMEKRYYLKDLEELDVRITFYSRALCLIDKNGVTTKISVGKSLTKDALINIAREVLKVTGLKSGTKLKQINR